MLEANWSDIEHSTGEREAYWLMAIEAAREYNAKRQRQTTWSGTTGEGS
jgi:hypothetical protein